MDTKVGICDRSQNRRQLISKYRNVPYKQSSRHTPSTNRPVELRTKTKKKITWKRVKSLSGTYRAEGKSVRAITLAKTYNKQKIVTPKHIRLLSHGFIWIPKVYS